VEARQEAVGKQVAWKLGQTSDFVSVHFLTPCGPSATIIAGMFRQSLGAVDYGLVPLQRAAFSSIVIFLRMA
jgi:hypothetical protein